MRRTRSRMRVLQPGRVNDEAMARAIGRGNVERPGNIGVDRMSELPRGVRCPQCGAEVITERTTRDNAHYRVVHREDGSHIVERVK